MKTLHDAAQAACQAAGLQYRDVPTDGRWHALDLLDDPKGRGDGRLKLFADGQGGLVHNWKTSDKPQAFFVDTDAPLSDAERRAQANRRQAALRKAEREAEHLRQKAAARAVSLWEAATPAGADHPYLVRKGVPPVPTLRELPLKQAVLILGYRPQSDGQCLEGRLLVVPIQHDHRLVTVELIDEVGRKTALYGGPKGGGYWVAQALPADDGAGLTLALGEGVATVLTARLATGYAGVAALSASNLPRVAETLRRRYPAARLVILADLGNGHAQAVAAASAAGAALATPVFPPDAPGSDWNDLAARIGLEAVGARLKLAATGAAAIPDLPPAPRLAGMISAAQLCARTFPPIRWAVPGLLPAGVTLLAGAPKTGKSWLALDLAVAVASGGLALGQTPVDPGQVLYLALEDNLRRLQSRLLKRLAGAPAPETLEFATEWPRLDQGAVDRLKEWLDQRPGARLIIIDTLARIRPPTKSNKGLYEADYAIGQALLKLAADYGVAIVLVHHTRKGDASDPLELISGSTGLTGGVDNVIVLKRARGADDATLYVTGRDIEHEAEYGLKWTAQTAGWTLTGQGPHIGLGLSPERRALFDLIAQHGPISGKDLAVRLHPDVTLTRESKEWVAVRKLLAKLAEQGLIRRTAAGFVVAGTADPLGTPDTPGTPDTLGTPGTRAAAPQAFAIVGDLPPPDTSLDEGVTGVLGVTSVPGVPVTAEAPVSPTSGEDDHSPAVAAPAGPAAGSRDIVYLAWRASAVSDPSHPDTTLNLTWLVGSASAGQVALAWPGAPRFNAAEGRSWGGRLG